MIDWTYYQRNRAVILNRVEDYYENDKERLIEHARDTYRNLSEEEKKIKRENIEKTDNIICNRYHTRLKKYQKHYREAKKSQYNNQ